MVPFLIILRFPSVRYTYFTISFWLFSVSRQYFTPRQHVLVCSYANLLGQVWGWCSLEPCISLKWQIFLTVPRRLPQRFSFSLILCDILFKIDIQINPCYVLAACGGYVFWVCRFLTCIFHFFLRGKQSNMTKNKTNYKTWFNWAFHGR
jgi:hypothetical protein